MAWLAPPGLEATVYGEIARPVARRGRLIFGTPQDRPVHFAQNTWCDPRPVAIQSVKDGARRLRALQRNWWCHRTGHDRRARTIASHLPRVRAPAVAFPAAAPTAPLGAWTLVAPDTIVAAPTATAPFPDGEPVFVEDRRPPNRAYLKLWEALCLLGTWPGPGERVLDLGASPGGWTWVAAMLGARVTAVDRAALDPAVAGLANAEERRGSAFAVDPGAAGPVDWLLADIACYPERLLDLVRAWLEAGAARRLVVTVKFQGTADPALVDAFAALPGAALWHLAHNKHELTLVIPGPAGAPGPGRCP